VFDVAHAVFATPWAQFDLPSLEAFLAGAPHEDLFWDAKQAPATKEELKKLIHRHVCGFANASGGCLILGAAEQPGGTWKLDGIPLSMREPADWVTSIVRLLRPVPVFDVQAFSLPSGNHALVIVCDRGAIPPCESPDGSVHQRQGNQTVLLKGRDIAALSRTGATARARLKANASRSAREAAYSPLVHFGFACATGERPAEESVYSHISRTAVRSALKEKLVEHYGGDARISDLETYSTHEVDSMVTRVSVDQHVWVVEINPERRTSSAIVDGRPPRWASGAENIDEILQSLSIARDVAIASERSLGTPAQSPISIGIATRRPGVSPISRRAGDYLVVTQGAALGPAGPEWDAWVRADFIRLLPISA
jgi:hypothetical protein